MYIDIELLKKELSSCPEMFENDYYFEFDSELNKKVIELKSRKNNEITNDCYCEYGVTEAQKQQAKDDEKYCVEVENYFNNKEDKININDYINSDKMVCRICNDKINNIDKVGYVYTNCYESVYVSCYKCEYLYTCECGIRRKNTRDKQFNISRHLRTKQHINDIKKQQS